MEKYLLLLTMEKHLLLTMVKYPTSLLTSPLTGQKESSLPMMRLQTFPMKSYSGLLAGQNLE